MLFCTILSLFSILSTSLCLRVTVGLEPGKPFDSYTEATQPGLAMNFSYANLKSQAPINVTCWHVDENNNPREQLFSYNESFREQDEGYIAPYAGRYLYRFQCAEETKVEIDLSVDNHGKLLDEDMTQEGSTIENLKDTLNKLKKDLQELRGRIKGVLMRENRNMITVETVESRILKFSIFEVMLMISLSLGSVYVLKTYFQTHLKKGVA